MRFSVLLVAAGTEIECSLPLKASLDEYFAGTRCEASYLVTFEWGRYARRLHGETLGGRRITEVCLAISCARDLRVCAPEACTLDDVQTRIAPYARGEAGPPLPLPLDFGTSTLCSIH